MSKRFLPLGILIFAAVIIWMLDVHHYLSFETLKLHRQELKTFVADHLLWAALVYMAIYVAVVALSIPGAAFMTITGGFLFGQLRGAAMVVIAATLGATVVFISVKMATKSLLRTKIAPYVTKMEQGFKDNALNYLLVLRLIPIFPFFMVNLVAAILLVPLRTFVLATFFGIIPGSFVYVSVGTGLASIIDHNQEFTTQGILTPEILMALVGLAILAVLPVIYKKWQNSR